MTGAHLQAAAYHEQQVTVLDLADRLLEKGAAVAGDLVISVAGVDLVFISLRALVASVETAMGLELAKGTIPGDT